MNPEEKNESNELSVKQQIIPEEVSKRITALRFLLAMLVVFIHNNYTKEAIAKSVAEGLPNIVFCPNLFTEWVQLFISQGIARCAVPLFFIFAAYLQVKKSDKYNVLLLKRFKTIFLPFVLWTCIYLFYYGFVKLLILKIAPSIIHNPDQTILNWTITDWIHNILYREGAASLPKLAYQLWFLRDLMILIIISPILNLCVKKFEYGFLFIICVLYVIPIKVYFVIDHAIFFYVIGLYFGNYNWNVFEKIDSIKWIESILLVILSIFITHIFFGISTNMYNLMVISVCIFMLKLSKLIINREKFYNIASYLSGFSFFLYAIHTPVLNDLIIRVWIHIFPMKNPFFCLFEYFGVTILTIIIGTLIGIVLKKICPPLFSILNGGRR